MTMASVSKDSKGWRIRFVDHAGTRRQIRPGKVNKSTAQNIARHCEILTATKAADGVIPRQTAVWLGDISDRLHGKISGTGLVEPRVCTDSANRPTTVLEFADAFIKDGKTLSGKPASDSTKRKWKTARNHLEKHLPKGKMLHEVTPSDAQSFRQYLEKIRIRTTGKPMRENAKRKVLASTKVMFNKAVRLELIERNPFEHEASSSITIRDRDFFVTPGMTQKLLNTAPDAQWKLMIALWRLAGLRKMEIHNLTWGDILKEKGRFRVRATKTAHMEGREIRFVPLAPVLSYLEEAWQAALPAGQRSPPAEAPIITRFSPSNVNLHKPFLKIIEAAGLKPWPKLIQNLRASCETAWLDSGIPAHVVANWIGHSVRVQNESYAQVDDHHFDNFNRAYEEKVAHIVAQQNAADSCTERQQVTPDLSRTQQKPAWAEKKLDPKTELNALERSRTSTPITGT
ncbi:MAG: hypothetical protein Fues2KO_26980 [Fuerstiella sp.]